MESSAGEQAVYQHRPDVTSWRPYDPLTFWDMQQEGFAQAIEEFGKVNVGIVMASLDGTTWWIVNEGAVAQSLGHRDTVTVTMTYKMSPMAESVNVDFDLDLSDNDVVRKPQPKFGWWE